MYTHVRPPLSYGRGQTTVKPVCLAGAKASKLSEGLGLAAAGEQNQKAAREEKAGGGQGWARIPIGNKGQICISSTSRQPDRWT